MDVYWVYHTGFLRLASLDMIVASGERRSEYSSAGLTCRQVTAMLTQHSSCSGHTGSGSHH